MFLISFSYNFHTWGLGPRPRLDFHMLFICRFRLFSSFNESVVLPYFHAVNLYNAGSDQTTLLQSRVQVSIDDTDSLSSEALREHVCLHDLVQDFQFSHDFYGQAMAPLGPGQNSMHSDYKHVSRAVIWTRFR